MQKILIIEDEPAAAKRLVKMIQALRPAYQVLDTVDSIQSAVQWFQRELDVDLVFMDIQLADGLSFSIFNEVEIRQPIIFTTAFDQYVLKAFKVNSVDYLLKPIDADELEQAIEKHEKLNRPLPKIDASTIALVREALQGRQFKERFLIKSGKGFNYLPVGDIAYFYAEEGINFIRTHAGERYILEMILDQVEGQLDPGEWFRISRKFIIHHRSIGGIQKYFNSRLVLDLVPSFDGQVIVSRERVVKFKQWLNK